MVHSIPFLQLQPDEAVAGYLGRLALRLGLEWQSRDVRRPLRERVRELGHNVDDDPLTIVALFSGTTRQDIIEFHSIAPFSYAFDWRGLPFSEIPVHAGNRTREIFGLFTKPKTCPQCVQSDLQELGISYWRRSHQIPGAIYCPRHDKRLIAITTDHSYYRQPHHLLSSLQTSDVQHKVANMFHDRMTQIWMIILSARKSINVWHPIDLVMKHYSVERDEIWNLARMNIKSASKQYSLEMSQFRKEPGSPDQGPYHARLLVAALAASNIEVQHLIRHLRIQPRDVQKMKSLSSSQPNLTSKVCGRLN